MPSEMDDTETLALMDNVELVASGVPGGRVKIVAYYTGGDDREEIHADYYPKRFYKQRTARGEIKNAVKEGLENTPVDEGEFVKAWKGWTSKMVAADEELDVVPPNVRELARGTESVKVNMGGETREWKVKIDWNGRTGEVVLDHNDMASGGVTALKSQLFKEFANSPDIEPEDWDELRDYWLDMQEETTVETMTETDMAVEGFLDELRHRITPHADADALLNGKEAVWVDWDNEHGLMLNGQTDGVDGIVWVRSDLVSDIVNGMESPPPIGKLGSELGQRGHTVRGSENLQPSGGDTKRRYWFFAVGSLKITEMDVHTDDDGDAPGGVEA